MLISIIAGHVLPDGFQRIPHTGFLANGHRRAKLALIRKLLAVSPIPDDRPHDGDGGAESSEPPPCPCCGGRMIIVEILPGPRRHGPRRLQRLDSS